MKLIITGIRNGHEVEPKEYTPETFPVTGVFASISKVVELPNFVNGHFTFEAEGVTNTIGVTKNATPEERAEQSRERRLALVAARVR
jgi:hypothetical protein